VKLALRLVVSGHSKTAGWSTSFMSVLLFAAVIADGHDAGLPGCQQRTIAAPAGKGAGKSAPFDPPPVVFPVEIYVIESSPASQGGL
jgi:hypothetical protein